MGEVNRAVDIIIGSYKELAIKNKSKVDLIDSPVLSDYVREALSDVKSDKYSGLDLFVELPDIKKHFSIGSVESVGNMVYVSAVATGKDCLVEKENIEEYCMNETLRERFKVENHHNGTWRKLITISEEAKK